LLFVSGEVERAIDLYEESITIFRASGNRRNEGQAMGGLGNAYAELGQPEKAREFHLTDLKIAREFGDKSAEGRRW